ncbi:plastid movement impaired protein [Parasponia andersonii]|uniref:Plastid movement impaired protein n=1 Tax=Parasponia andersonii TaxID=3476 RepID=A0A2P5DVW1_PARAD|nr:plastid movement impaired protein [Parasponia andersonii]
MGNTIGGGRKRVKVMKINGETFKLKIPVRVGEVVKDHPGHVILDSEAVKHFGVRAKPLEAQQELKPKKLYFLVELPTFFEDDHHKTARRVRSGINMSAKERLECLMLSRRAISDLSMVRPSSRLVSGGQEIVPDSGPMRVKMRLPRAQVAKLVEESRDEVEVAEKIIDLYMENGGRSGGDVAEVKNGGLLLRDERRKPALGSVSENYKAREKRVSFLPIEEGEIRLEVES